MSMHSFLARWTTRAAAVAVLVCNGSPAPAADVAPPAAPAVVGAAPVTVGDPGCATCTTCQHGGAKATCSKCNKSLILGALQQHKNKGPYPVTLCPGACFGYFQTQWRKWDDVCPYPYLGTGVGDAPRPPAGVLNPRPAGSDLAPPRPLDPKVMPDPKKSDLPPIPPVPNKFGP